MFVLYAFAALCSLAGISAGERGEGCFDLTPLRNFNHSKYLGTWYESTVADWNPKLKCVKFTSFAAPSGKIEINTFGFDINDNSLYSVSGDIMLPYANKPGRWEIIPKQLSSDHIIQRWILETDYTSYSVEYECCQTIPALRILTRQPNPPQSVIDKGMKVIRKIRFDTENYVKTDQGCWKSEVPSNEKKTATKASETEERRQKKPFSLNLDITITSQKFP